MSSKDIYNLSGVCRGGAVLLTWYKSTPVYEGDREASSRFSIYRKEVPGFRFNWDYEEYFSDLRGSFGKRVFRGTVRCTNRRKYTWRDRDVQVGRTYVYFVKPESSAAAGPLPLKVRDHAVWWPYDRMCRSIETLRKKFPRWVKTGVCGRTVRGREIPYFVAGRGRPAVGLLGLVHAGESGPELIIPAVRWLLTARPGLLRRGSIVAVPAANIDGREEMVQGTPWYIRTNAAGVDINRNFPPGWEGIERGYGLRSDDPESPTYRGPFPASEPETRAVMEVFSEHTPQVIFAFHHLSSICGLPGIGPALTKSDDAFRKRSDAFIGLYGRGLYADKGVTSGWAKYGGPNSGTLPLWCKEALGVPAFDLELGGVDRRTWSRSTRDRTDRKLLRDYQLRHRRAICEVFGHCVGAGAASKAKRRK